MSRLNRSCRHIPVQKYIATITLYCIIPQRCLVVAYTRLYWNRIHPPWFFKVPSSLFSRWIIIKKLFRRWGEIKKSVDYLIIMWMPFEPWKLIVNETREKVIRGLRCDSWQSTQLMIWWWVSRESHNDGTDMKKTSLIRWWSSSTYVVVYLVKVTQRQLTNPEDNHRHQGDGDAQKLLVHFGV